MKETNTPVTSHYSGLEDIGNGHHMHANVSCLKQLSSRPQQMMIELCKRLIFLANRINGRFKEKKLTQLKMMLLAHKAKPKNNQMS